MTRLEKTSPWDDTPAVTKPARRAWYARQLTADDTFELMAQMALLAERGLPLPAGLRALAAEQGDARIGRALASLAEQLELGHDFSTALEKCEVPLPDAERAVIVAAIQSGRFAEVIEEHVENRQRSRELRRRMRNLLAYPALVTVLSLFLLILLDWLVISMFRETFADFQTELPTMTAVLFAVSDSLVYALTAGLCGGLAVWILVLLGSRAAFRRRLLHRVPLVGSLWRYTSLADFSNFAGMLVQCGVPLPDALHHSAASTGDPDLRNVVAGIAQALVDGKPLGARLAAESRLPAGLAQVVTWGEDRGTLAASLKLAGEMFTARAHAQLTLASIIGPPFGLAMVVSVFGFVVMGLLVPMITLFQKLL